MFLHSILGHKLASLVTVPRTISMGGGEWNSEEKNAHGRGADAKKEGEVTIR